MGGGGGGGGGGGEGGGDAPHKAKCLIGLVAKLIGLLYELNILNGEKKYSLRRGHTVLGLRERGEIQGAHSLI